MSNPKIHDEEFIKMTSKQLLDLVECASCQRELRMNSEDLMNTTCQLCGGEAK